MNLTDTKCKNAQPADKAKKLSDGKGLYLEVMPNGSKYWRLKYRINGKEKRLALGVYPEVTLKVARDATDTARRKIAEGIDPSLEKQLKKVVNQKAAENTFKAVALEWHEIQSERWSEKYAYKIKQGLEKNIFPYIGKRLITEITPPELLTCLRETERRGSYDIAGRSKQICGQIFRYGIQTGRCERDASADLRGALKTKKTEHFRTIDFTDIPEFMDALRQNKARLYERTHRAVWLSLYTFCRPKEIRMARWKDIDLDIGIWSIPAEFMKMKKAHIVPLSRQVIEILKEQEEECAIFDTPWVFPSQVRPKNPMSDGTVNKAIKRLGYGKDMVAHGFRALARTTIREKLRYESEVIEKQLAHKTSNPLGEAYDRTQFLDERKKMMQDWANFVDSQTSENKIIHARFK